MMRAECAILEKKGSKVGLMSVSKMFVTNLQVCGQLLAILTLLSASQASDGLEDLFSKAMQAKGVQYAQLSAHPYQIRSGRWIPDEQAGVRN